MKRNFVKKLTTAVIAVFLVFSMCTVNAGAQMTVSAEKGADATQVILNWSAVSGASYYKVAYERGDGSKKGWDSTKVTDTSFTSTGNQTSQSFYTFTIHAMDASESELSQTSVKYYMPGNTPATTGVASVVKESGGTFADLSSAAKFSSGVHAEKGADATQVNLSWSAVPGAAYYKVAYERGDGSKKGWDSTKVTGTSFTSTGNQTSQSFYTFTIHAMSASGSELTKSSIKYDMPQSQSVPTDLRKKIQNYWDPSFTVYQQNSYDSEISRRGCGPSSLTNAIRYHYNVRGKSKYVNLESVYNMTRDQNLFSSGGVSIWGMASNSTIQKSFGFKAEELFGYNTSKSAALKTKAINKLNSGSVFLVSAPNSYYHNSNSGYHVTAIVGYTPADNTVLILDSANRTNNYGYNGSSVNYPNARDFDGLWDKITCMYEIIPN